MNPESEKTDPFCNVQPFEFPALHSGRNPKGIILRAEQSGDPGLFQEIAVGAFQDGKAIADIHIGLDEKGDLRVLVTASGEGEGDHVLAVYPERPKNKMTEKFD